MDYRLRLKIRDYRFRLIMIKSDLKIKLKIDLKGKRL